MQKLVLLRDKQNTCGSDIKESSYNAGPWVWSLGWEDPLGKGMDTYLIQ